MGSCAMNPPAFRTLLLRAHLGLLRFGWSNLLAYMFGATALAVALWCVPHARNGLAHEQRALARATKELNNTATQDIPLPMSPNEERLNRFYRALGERRY